MYKYLENPYVYNFSQFFVDLVIGKALSRLKKMAQNKCNGKVLELGCGTGKFADIFDSNYAGLDINIEYLKHNSNKAHFLIQGNAVLLPFKDNFFDSIFCHGMFHHIDILETQKIFSEIKRVCKPNATILISEPFYPDNKLNILGFLLCKLDRGNHIRTVKEFKTELGNFFNSIEYVHLKGGYPYNLTVFILQSK